VEKRPKKQPRVLDYRIKKGGLTRQGSWLETAKRNLDIIELVKKLDKERREATATEKKLLSQYTGFGASEIANNLFPGYAQYGHIKVNWAQGAWKELAKRVTELMTPEEIRRIDNRLGAPFEYEAELHTKVAEAATLEGELAAEGKKAEEKEGEGEATYSRTNNKAWPADFPNATLHTTPKKLRSHPDYKAAKAGDTEAAIRLVSDLAKADKARELFEEYGDAVVVAPHAEEEAGRNAIPRVFAEFLHDAGFKVDTDIVQINKAARTKKGSALRLAVRPEFSGKVVKGQRYLLVDDALGLGGTINDLRHYIESNGGSVVKVSSLTAGIFGGKLSIRSETIAKLEKKFGKKQLEDFHYEFNVAKNAGALTEKEGRYILKQSSLNALRDRIVAQAREAGIGPSSWQVQTSFSRLVSPARQPANGSPSGRVTIQAEKLRRKLAKDLNRDIPKGEITQVLVRDLLPPVGPATKRAGAGSSRAALTGPKLRIRSLNSSASE